MDSLPAHQPLFDDDDTDEELSDVQVRELLKEAAQRMRAKAASQPVTTADAPFKLPKLKPGHIAHTHEKMDGNITRLDHSQLVDKKQQALADGIKKIEDPLQVRKLRKLEEKKATAGAQWFNMPKTELTPELRRDLQLLKMRSVLDPKRHYKKDNSKNDVPAFSQVGTVIEGATEFYSSRLNKKDRKQTILEEVISQEQGSGRFKRKYADIAKTKASGKKAFYNALQAKRSKNKVIKP
ncbi:nucleolus protein-like protein required for cell viability [Cucurbitaria berberidis CBS 394.84]|uniref:Nucleolus protein-like protein required for cell viability n=1 Tax=Cucurbitaria berberidis CBS 394.84 TaxID=1168544 RepID=A0A9P4LE80_9PLEO|nr:nucleolus protein-like protein required for cell viability [Cucurbitaria berberidis CBS 394.84]KAF1851122.1 nucleolus protein-like protein required for cell viability [Cucurbitaria berberidis CBS 394.84]